MKHKLRIAVRNLVEFILRSGDLDLSSFGIIHPAEGLRIHQEIQNSRPPEYNPEVPILQKIETPEFILEISGRIDGVYVYPDRVIIEEIKTTKKDPVSYRDQENNLHWGQAKCYAFMYATQHVLNDVAVRVTYYQIETGVIKEFERVFSIKALEGFFNEMVDRYLVWTARIVQWMNTRDVSIHDLTFPFTSFRPGQEAIIEKTQEVIEHGDQLLLQAPTGIGKTMAVIYATLKAIPQQDLSNIFYLTARTTGRVAAETTFEILRQHGLRCKVLSLTAKEKVCFNTDRICNGNDCEYARGFFNRLTGALKEALTRDDLTRDVVITLAQKHRICPFEFSLEISLWVDYIICDYNYAFDPKVYLRRFFQDSEGNYVFLVDEAHNLVDRAREMYSAELSKQSFETLQHVIRNMLPWITRSLDNVNQNLLDIEQECMLEGNPRAERDQPQDLYPSLINFASAAEKWLGQNEFTPFRQSLLDTYFSVKRFLWTADQYDDTYATYYKKNERDLKIKLMCLDPSQHMARALQRSRGTIFFSATLHPVDFFIESLGCHKEASTLTLPSPFDSENLCVLIANKISTLYKYRDFTKVAIARAICSLVDQRKGNYLVFLPSYEYMTAVCSKFQQQRSRIDTITQAAGMTEKEREDFIARFRDTKDTYLIGFAVMGGVFAESIDLFGEQLTGAVIIGVGMPAISLERELIKDYYDHKLGAGFAFAYQYPGMIKVLQAAGRVIRSEQDRGSLLLIDTRYARPDYMELLPDEWQIRYVKDYEEIMELLQRYWRQKRS